MSLNLPKSVFGKAHDIGFAVFRVAHVVKNMRLRMALEDAAVDLVASPADGTVDKLLALIKLTASINEIRALNAEVLEREVSTFGSGAHIIVPQKHRDKKAVVIITKD